LWIRAPFLPSFVIQLSGISLTKKELPPIQSPLLEEEEEERMREKNNTDTQKNWLRWICEGDLTVRWIG
jgi:hypothetical protein